MRAREEVVLLNAHNALTRSSRQPIASFPVRIQVSTGERLLLIDLKRRQSRLLKGGEQLPGILHQWKRVARVVFPENGIQVNLSVLVDRHRKGVITLWKREGDNPEEEMSL